MLTRYPGRVLGAEETPPRAMLKYVADQIGATPEAFTLYARREETRRDAIVLIESRKGRDVWPEQAASMVGLSPRQFARLFQQGIGMTPKRFIIETRLRYARFLVENGTRSMTENAFETGFSDVAHFATAFRKKYERAPRQFR